jgi:hypothetical protein
MTERGITLKAGQDLPLIKVVGLSASGKSTLVALLRQCGYHARPVSQEHSHVATLWRQFDLPRVLIYLETTLAAQQQRRPDVTWTQEELLVEQERLAHARDHADLRIDTTELKTNEVAQIALTFLESRKIAHLEQPLPPLSATGSAILPKVEN